MTRINENTTIEPSFDVGFYLTVRRDKSDDSQSPDIQGKYAAVIDGPNGAYFTIDAQGNIRGNPEAVEREMLAIGVSDNLLALAGLGLARLALKSVKV